MSDFQCPTASQNTSYRHSKCINRNSKEKNISPAHTPGLTGDLWDKLCKNGKAKKDTIQGTNRRVSWFSSVYSIFIYQPFTHQLKHLIHLWNSVNFLLSPSLYGRWEELTNEICFLRASYCDNTVQCSAPTLCRGMRGAPSHMHECTDCMFT